MVRATIDKKYENKYTIDGCEYKELAIAENKVRDLINRGYIQIIIEKNGKPYEAFVKRLNGELVIHKLNKGVSYE